MTVYLDGSKIKTVSTLESFERTSPLADYKISNGSTLSDYYNVVSSPVADGSKAVERINSANTWRYIVRQSPPETVARGNVYQMKVQEVSSTTPGYASPVILAGFDGSGEVNGYKVQVKWKNGSYVSVRRLDSSAETDLKKTSLSSNPTEDSYVTVEIDLTNGDDITGSVIDVDGKNLGAATATDSTYDNNSYGVGAYRETPVFDNLVQV